MYPVATQCRVLGVSPSGYYAWQTRLPPGPRSGSWGASARSASARVGPMGCPAHSRATARGRPLCGPQAGRPGGVTPPYAIPWCRGPARRSRGRVFRGVAAPGDVVSRGGGGWMPSIAKPSIPQCAEYPYVKPDPLAQGFPRASAIVPPGRAGLARPASLESATSLEFRMLSAGCAPPYRHIGERRQRIPQGDAVIDVLGCLRVPY